MKESKQPTIWHYLVWGLIVGWIGSFIIIKFKYIFESSGFLIVGVVMGLTTGISNYSFRKSIFSILAGLTIGILLFNNHLHIVGQDFLYYLPPLLFWYAAAITLCLTIFDLKKEGILICTLLSLMMSYVATGIIYALGWFSIGASIGKSFTCYQSVDTPQIIVGMIAITLFNITMNFSQWRNPSNIRTQ